uniref:Uncharacterized protein n=1 Tax=Anguilla anguilla TaxID=7936 RepID=A0A0E9PU46_ANGAN
MCVKILIHINILKLLLPVNSNSELHTEKFFFTSTTYSMYWPI